jgi:amidase
MVATVDKDSGGTAAEGGQMSERGDPHDLTAYPHDLTALEQAVAIRTGQLSAVELVEHYLGRIEALGGPLGAFVTVTADAARVAARAADEAVGAQARDLPPLHGVPIAIKDLTMTAGVRTTFGSKAFADFVPPVDADVVTALRAAGTISLGKTTCSEFGISLYSEGLVAPPARNPWDPSMTAGGSSGGSAAAVAAGLVPVAHGTDGGGSLRIPAAICQLVGFKPSRGVVSGGPLGSAGFGLPTNGPIGRTVTDVAALLDAMAAPFPGEPFPPPPRPAGGYLAAALRAEPGRLMIGRFTRPMLADVPVDPVCLAAVDEAAAALGELGHEVIEVEPPMGPGETGYFETLWSVLTLAPVPPERVGDLLPITRYLRGLGERIGAAELLRAQTQLQAVVRAGARRYPRVDLLLCPTLARPQAPVGYFAELDPAEDFREQERFSPFCAIFNVTGAPSVSLPVGGTGVLLSAAAGADALLLAAAAQLCAARPATRRHPAAWHGEVSATVDPSHGSSDAWGR